MVAKILMQTEKSTSRSHPVKFFLNLVLDLRVVNQVQNSV
jgi:hypothetical protein